MADEGCPVEGVGEGFWLAAEVAEGSGEVGEGAIVVFEAIDQPLD